MFSKPTLNIQRIGKKRFFAGIFVGFIYFLFIYSFFILQLITSKAIFITHYIDVVFYSKLFFALFAASIGLLFTAYIWTKKEYCRHPRLKRIQLDIQTHVWWMFGITMLMVFKILEVFISQPLINEFLGLKNNFWVVYYIFPIWIYLSVWNIWCSVFRIHKLFYLTTIFMILLSLLVSFLVN